MGSGETSGTRKGSEEQVDRRSEAVFNSMTNLMNWTEVGFIFLIETSVVQFPLRAYRGAAGDAEMQRSRSQYFQTFPGLLLQDIVVQ